MRHTTLSGWTLMFTVASLGIARAGGIPRPSPPAPDLGRTVTMTGCLRSWDGSPAGIGRGDATGPGAQFVLTNVEETVPATPRTPVGTSGKRRRGACDNRGSGPTIPMSCNRAIRSSRSRRFSISRSRCLAHCR